MSGEFKPRVIEGVHPAATAIRTFHFALHPDIVAEGFDGLNHWRKRRLPNGEIQEECSDDKVSWHPGLLSEGGRARRAENERQPERRAAASDPVAAADARQAIGAAALMQARFPWWQLALASALGASAPVALHILHAGGF